ncbi:prolyl oligopeptidase family serine peptidase [Streptomyces sp. NPDC047070]|uniref:alpha/beta hydrolase family protein n=1 Tax=Streptomyces sp. NPDC047070 TaxID=3154923 RepID=UPI00345308E7
MIRQEAGGNSDGLVRDRVTAWLESAEGPGFGRVTRFGHWDVTLDGGCVAAVGTVLDGLDRPGRDVLCVIATADGDLRQYDLAADLVSAGTGTVAVASRDRVHWFDLSARTPDAGPVLPGRIEQLRVSADGLRALVVLAADQPSRYDLAERVIAEPSQREPLVFTAEPERFRQCYVVDRRSGSVRNVTPADANVWEVCWAGPDAALAVCADRPGESGWYSPYLARLDLESSTADVLYRPRIGRQLAEPAWTADRWAIVEATCSDRGVVAGEVVLGSLEGTPVHLDTQGVAVSSLRDTAQGQFAYAGLRGLMTAIGRVDAGKASTTEVWSSAETFAGQTAQIRIDAAGRVHGFLESYETLPRLVTVDGTQVRTVFDPAHGGTAFVRKRAGTKKEISWTSPDGQEIEGLLVVPDGPPPHPLVVNVHGGPVSAWRNRWGIASGERYPLAPMLASEGYAVLHPNPRGSHGRGEEFARAVLGDMFGAPVRDLLSGIDHLVAQGVADPERIAVTGTSYGAVMSLALPAIDRRFAAAIAVSPVSDWVSQHYTSDIPRFDELFLQDSPSAPDSKYFHQSPLFMMGQARTPTLVTAGLRDKCTPPQQAVEAHQALLRNGVDTELVLYPAQGHGVKGFPETTDYLGRLLVWLQRHLPTA